MYTIFARFYDEMMSDVAYDEWVIYLNRLIKKYLNQPSEPSLVLELGCGTGTLTTKLAMMGYDMIGLDNAESMLIKAKEKTDWLIEEGSINQPILYLNQNMEEMELFGSVDVILSMCDSMNYLLEEKDFLAVLERSYYYLNPGGIMVFDLNTAYKFSEEIGDATYGENHEDYSFIWENYFEPSKMIHEYIVTLFVKEGKTYKKYEEVHYEKAYHIEDVVKMIEKVGFKIIEVNGDMGLSELEEASKHYYILTKD